MTECLSEILLQGYTNERGTHQILSHNAQPKKSYGVLMEIENEGTSFWLQEVVRELWPTMEIEML